jgi:hypothetical protein
MVDTFALACLDSLAMMVREIHRAEIHPASTPGSASV